ncbi:MAG: cytochrome C oxidase subunit IV family protein [Anaerolineales bacterium]
MERVQASRPNYLVVFGILAGFTLIETLISYVQQEAIRLPVLLGLSAVKAVLVLLYFMHLKMDSKVFSYLFIAGLVLAIPLILVMTIVMPIIARY